MEIEDIKIFHQHRSPNKKGEPNNDFIAACYALYVQGYSIRQIASNLKDRKITHQALYDMFKVRRYRLRSKKKLPEIVYKGKRFRPDPAGLYRLTDRGIKNVYLHRLIWEESNGPIPEDHYIVFKDGDKSNVALDNLECLSSKEVKKKYNYANQNGYKRFPGKGAFGFELKSKNKAILPS